MIYIGLIVLWAYTVKDRILPTKTRTYMLASSGFMIVYLPSMRMNFGSSSSNFTPYQ